MKLRVKKSRLESLEELVDEFIEYRLKGQIEWEKDNPNHGGWKPRRRDIRIDFNHGFIKQMKILSKPEDPDYSNVIGEDGDAGVIREINKGEELNERFLEKSIDVMCYRIKPKITRLLSEVEAEEDELKERDVEVEDKDRKKFELMIGVAGCLLILLSLYFIHLYYDIVLNDSNADWAFIAEGTIAFIVGFSMSLHFGVMFLFYGFSGGKSAKIYMYQYPLGKLISKIYERSL